MTIYRRIFRMMALRHPIRPCISDDAPEGINWRVLAYDGNHAIVECWCSDHPILEPNDRKTMGDLKRIDTRVGTIDVLKTHPQSPTILGQHTISVFHHSPPNAEVDEVKQTITFRGRTGHYLRKIRQKTHTRHGDEDLYILDEG